MEKASFPPSLCPQSIHPSGSKMDYVGHRKIQQPRGGHFVDMEERTILEEEIPWASWKFPTQKSKSSFGQPKDGIRAFWAGWTGVKAEQRRGDSTKGGGLEGKKLASFPVGAATASRIDFVGLRCSKFGKRHISGLSSLSHLVHISPPYPVPTLRGKKGASYERGTDAIGQLVRGGGRRGQMLRSCLGLPPPGVFRSILLTFLWEHFYSLQLLVSPIK